ncbi:MAG: hypothetical protein ACK50J_23780, partial [Planctomyces sp.]
MQNMAVMQLRTSLPQYMTLLNGPPGDSADCVSWPPHNEHRGVHCHNQMTIACTIVRRFAWFDFRV